MHDQESLPGCTGESLSMRQSRVAGAGKIGGKQNRTVCHGKILHLRVSRPDDLERRLPIIRENAYLRQALVEAHARQGSGIWGEQVDT